MHLTKQITYMQTLTIKYTFLKALLILIFLLGSSFFAQQARAASAQKTFSPELFLEHFQQPPEINKQAANKITYLYSSDSSLTLAQQKNQLLKLQKKLDNSHKKYSKKAIFWFIQGLHYINMAAYYSQLNQPSEVNKYINKKNMAYQKSIALDREKLQLNASIYSTMKYGLPAKLKIDATQQELAQGGNSDSESQYWYLHWSNIDQLKNAGRDEEAKAAYAKMKKEMKKDQVEMDLYKELNSKIEKQTLKLDNTAKPQKPNTNNSKQQSISSKRSTVQDKHTIQEPFIEMKYLLIYSITIISFLSLLAVTIYEVRKKRKK